MRRFAWRLQKVLDIRRRQEQGRRTELFQTTERLAAKRGELLLRQRVLRDLLAEIGRHEPTQRLRVQEFFLRHAAADDEQMRRLQEEIAALDLRHQEQRAALLALRRSREGLEKLREQAWEQYRREQDRREQKDSDDRTAVAFVRRGGDIEN